MRNWYSDYIERQDDSYIKLYQAFFTLKAANLITDKQWKMIINYDRQLFEEASRINTIDL
jgi:hypothetical protein